jgi:hypothetical protein
VESTPRDTIPTPGPLTQAKVIDKVSTILLQLAKTVSSIKIFTLEHDSSQKLIHVLWQSLNAFLEKFPKLELGVQEFSFVFLNRPVYKDEKAIKSLPFLFYRDGMTKLFFHQSLREEELVEFLRIVGTAFEQPAESCDVVSMLWEKDLPNIRCLAPDVFLETKIGAQKEPPRLRAYPEDLISGVIDIPFEEMPEGDVPIVDLSFGPPVQMPLEGDEPAQWDGDQEEIYTYLSDQEDRRLGEMLQDNRKVSPLGEMVQLINEILLLERTPERFTNTMEVAFHLHQDLVQKAEFPLLTQLLMNVLELKTAIPDANSPQRQAVEKFLQRTRDQEALTLLKKSVAENRLILFQPFFEYIKLLGSESLSLVAELYDMERNPSFRSSISGYLLNVGRQVPQMIFNLVTPQRPGLVRDVITVLGKLDDRRVIPLLGQFCGEWAKPFKLEAIRALGKFHDPEASRALMGFLDDPDEEVRVIAANNMRIVADPLLMVDLEGLVRDKHFDKKALAERQAVFDLLGRARSPAAYDLLQGLLRKGLGFFRRTEKVSTRLCLIQALERFPTPRAREILNRGARLRNRTLRLACQTALARMKFGDERGGINPPEAP